MRSKLSNNISHCYNLSRNWLAVVEHTLVGYGQEDDTMEQRKQLGNTSEALAQAYLEKQGFLLLQANFSCKRGELDLIMRPG